MSKEMYELFKFLCGAFDRSLEVYHVTKDDKYMEHCASIMVVENIIYDHG